MKVLFEYISHFLLKKNDSNSFIMQKLYEIYILKDNN